MRAIGKLNDIAGASYLFESHLGVTQTAGRSNAWADTQTGSGLVAVQSNPTQYPYYSASNVAFANYPTLDWPLSELANLLYLESGSLGVTVTSNLTYVSVFRTTNLSANHTVMRDRFVGAGQQLQNTVLLSTGALRWTGKSAPFLDSATGRVVVNTTYVLIQTRDSIQAANYLNGVQISQGSIGQGGYDGIRIGATFVNTITAVNPMVGSIAVCGAWPRTWTPGEIRLAGEFLMRRYGAGSLPSRVATPVGTRTSVPAPGSVGGRARIL